MARSSRIYVLTMWVSHEIIAAFTVKHEMHSYAKRHGLYDKNIRVTSVGDGAHGGKREEYQLEEPR